jgi:hypothetical protein
MSYDPVGWGGNRLENTQGENEVIDARGQSRARADQPLIENGAFGCIPTIKKSLQTKNLCHFKHFMICSRPAYLFRRGFKINLL